MRNATPWEKMVERAEKEAFGKHQDAFEEATRRFLESRIPGARVRTYVGTVTPPSAPVPPFTDDADFIADALAEEAIAEGINVDYAILTAPFPVRKWEEGTEPFRCRDADGNDFDNYESPAYPEPWPPEVTASH